MPTIGISLIAHNEQAQIASALRSAAFADQVILVDCGSTDRTVEIAAGFQQVRVFHRKNDPNLNVNKSFGIAQLSTDWAFYLDPDEVIPPPLASLVRQTISNSRHQGFRIPRRNHFFGRWLAHGGQYPDFQLRLFRRDRGSFPNRHVHESLRIDGTVGTLSEPFDHFPYPKIGDYLRKMNFYSTFQADFWASAGTPRSFLNGARFLALRPVSRFVRRYLLKRGFLDGWQGFLAAAGDAFQTVVSYCKFLERDGDENLADHPDS